MYDEEIMKDCARQAAFGSRTNIGGPFGAAIVKNGEIISLRSNSVLFTKDPTAHAEMNVIREASLQLNTYDLSDCELYATGYPCPMCLGAIMWSGIRKVYVSGMLEDAEKIGFQDKFIYETIDKLNKMCYNINVDEEDSSEVLDVEFHDRHLAQELYKNYKNQNKIVY